jgi:hypothetical protein
VWAAQLLTTSSMAISARKLMFGSKKSSQAADRGRRAVHLAVARIWTIRSDRRAFRASLATVHQDTLGFREHSESLWLRDVRFRILGPGI